MAADRLAEEFLALLTQPMERNPQEAVHRRHAAMITELKFRHAQEDRRLDFLRRKGWSDACFSTLFALNCVYQEVLGPLEASSRSGVAGLGSDHPIRQGASLSIDLALVSDCTFDCTSSDTHQGRYVRILTTYRSATVRSC
jgi:hypothetical protein